MATGFSFGAPSRRPRPARRPGRSVQLGAKPLNRPVTAQFRGGSNAVATPAVPGKPAPSPFTPDAEYLAWAAQNQFERQSELDRIGGEETTDRGDTAEAIRRLLSEQPKQMQEIKQSRNREGLFYSGTLTKDLDEHQANVTRQQGDMNLELQRRAAGRAAARNAILRGAPLQDAAARAAAVERKIERQRQARAQLLQSLGY